MDESLEIALHLDLAGHLDQMPTIIAQPAAAFTDASVGANLVLQRDAVVRVLQRLAAGDVTDAEAQRWASFVRRGYVAGERGDRVKPLDIAWETAHEAAIAETLARLDELGDLVDGTLRDGEIEDLIAQLSTDEAT